ncbi:hypothetical protein NYZ99_02295 [Maribacter litopenaei]|uniref:Uncharacterized protein n=1 Tax=Maribacter litopenaei TaxID=2976127 RepID=A0ABY5Y8R2_9FLAO|nr:hypothetical protein [Maribacter litopenaei]UWX55406.1 hypothetical protein NYZ99_02295 [Maribacter litopenaei]
MIFNELSDDVLFQANKFINEQTATLSGELIYGYCFDEDKDVIWLEGTAQMAVAFNSIQRFDLSEGIPENIEKTSIQSSISENAKGIPYTANFGTTYGENNLWDHSDITPALSATLWYYFAKTNQNPLEIDFKNTIPETDRFWSTISNSFFRNPLTHSATLNHYLTDKNERFSVRLDSNYNLGLSHGNYNVRDEPSL